jgi:hypothetical protein
MSSDAFTEGSVFLPITVSRWAKILGNRENQVIASLAAFGGIFPLPSVWV